MTNQPFFTHDGDAFIPTQAANGPWDPKSLHGRVVIGLLAAVIEQRHGADIACARAMEERAAMSRRESIKLLYPVTRRRP